MKKILVVLLFLFSFSALSACSHDNPSKTNADALVNSGVTIGIKSATIDADGCLIFTLEDGTIINAGYVGGQNGANGIDGKDGINGKNGVDGKDGVDGKEWYALDFLKGFCTA